MYLRCPKAETPFVLDDPPGNQRASVSESINIPFPMQSERQNPLGELALCVKAHIDKTVSYRSPMTHAGASPSLKLAITSLALTNCTTEEYLPMMGFKMAHTGLNAHGASIAATWLRRFG